jgi:hypothetical protein
MTIENEEFIKIAANNNSYSIELSCKYQHLS